MTMRAAHVSYRVRSRMVKIVGVNGGLRRIRDCLYLLAKYQVVKSSGKRAQFAVKSLSG